MKHRDYSNGEIPAAVKEKMQRISLKTAVIIGITMFSVPVLSEDANDWPNLDNYSPWIMNS